MKINDNVILSSGGPPMKVIRIEDDSIACYWYDVHGHPYAHVFNEASLLCINTMEEYMLHALDDKVF